MKRHHRQAWPRLFRESHETACHFCDTLYQIKLIKEGERANCSTCDQLLYYNRHKSVERAVAFALAGLLLFGLLFFFPFMQLSAQGNVIIMSMPEAVGRLWSEDGKFIAIAVGLFALVLPLAQLILLLYICIPLLAGRTLPYIVRATKLLQAIQPWVMLEVFFLGTIVSLLKLVKLADVQLLIGFWSLIALMICIAGSLSGIDRLELWDRIELARRKTKAQPKDTT
jgi:paraquat-inducible protein A